MSELRERDPALYAERLEELGYLANVLVSGFVDGDRRLRPVEAIEKALLACEAGLAAVLAERRPAVEREPVERALDVLGDVHLDQLFRRGFREAD